MVEYWKYSVVKFFEFGGYCFAMGVVLRTVLSDMALVGVGKLSHGISLDFDFFGSGMRIGNKE